MGYVSNRTINRLNIHAALIALLEQSSNLFAPLYLFTHGIANLPLLFLVLGSTNTARIPLRLLSIPLIKRFGLKRCLMLGAVGHASSYSLLPLVDGIGWPLALYILVFSTFNALQWHCFHLFYAQAGESEHRGKQVSVGAMLSAAVSAITPLVSGLLITFGSFERFFLLPLPLLCLMLWVLKGSEAPSLTHTPWREGKREWNSLGARLTLAEATVLYPLQLAWMLALFTHFQEMLTLGGVISFGMLAQMAYQAWLGRMIDRGHGPRVVHGAALLRLAQALLKAFVPLTLPRALMAETLTAAANTHHALAMPTAMYNTGKASRDPFWYWMFTEAAFDVGATIAALALAGLLVAGVPLQATCLLAIPGIFVTWPFNRLYFNAPYSVRQISKQPLDSH